MYAQVSLLGMSNPEPLDGEEGFKFDIMKRPALDFHETTPSPSSSSCSPTKEEGEMKAEISARKESEEKKKESDDDDDNDGFKTPTSLEHKIPEPKQCPPAPRRPRPLKRKASPSHSSNAAVVVRNLVQLLQPDSSKQVKKARTQEKQ
ncbi:hypothetical protein HRI_003320500 [Hibiscus trionum]|uniref:Uncharacterized protein n=1 Tax=Hibiscus trionum TaxID=183268 RepID=A0A9W7MAI3_HIBTR|nr:hypothetical protein HRI_003320500 [Hibiscus trionum]